MWERWWEKSTSSLIWTNCAWEFASQLDPAEDPLDLEQSMRQKQTVLGSIRAVCVLYSWFLFSSTSSALRSWMCISAIFKGKSPKSTPPPESYLPPFEGVLREDAVLSGHQRVDGLIEALRKPRVILQLCHALSAGAQTFGEKVVWEAESVLEEVERRVPEGITEEEHCKCDDTKQQSKSPDFPPLW